MAVSREPQPRGEPIALIKLTRLSGRTTGSRWVEPSPSWWANQVVSQVGDRRVHALNPSAAGCAKPKSTCAGAVNTRHSPSPAAGWDPAARPWGTIGFKRRRQALLTGECLAR